MTRTAAQKMARWLHNQYPRQFPLLELPAELQLRILCKCDLASLWHLIQLCPDLRGLFLRYSQSCLQEVLAEMPRPYGNLLLISSTLQYIDDQDFTPHAFELLIRDTNIFERFDIRDRVLPWDVDPLDNLARWADIGNEVRVISSIYAHNTIILMEGFVNPFVEVGPIVLSNTEFSRIACAFLLLRIYSQLQLKLLDKPIADLCLVSFVHRLQPWQKRQVLSVERFLESQPFGINTGSSLYNIASKGWIRSDNIRVQSAYARSFGRRFVWDDGSFTRPWVPFSVAIKRYDPSWSFISPNAPWISRCLVLEKLCLSPLYNDTDLCNHGWTFYQMVMDKHFVTDVQQRAFFLDLGFFFWDLDRLIGWELFDAADFPRITRTLEERFALAYQHRWLRPS